MSESTITDIVKNVFERLFNEEHDIINKIIKASLEACDDDIEIAVGNTAAMMFNYLEKDNMAKVNIIAQQWRDENLEIRESMVNLTEQMNKALDKA